MPILLGFSSIKAPEHVQIGQCESHTTKLVAVIDASGAKSSDQQFSSPQPEVSELKAKGQARTTNQKIEIPRTSTRLVPERRSFPELLSNQNLEERNKKGNGLNNVPPANPSQVSGHVVGETCDDPIRANDSQNA